MKNYARIVNGVAVEVFSPPEGFTIEECFHPDVVVQFTECPLNITANSTIDSEGVWTVFVPPVVIPTEPETPPIIITHSEFRALFSLAERTAIKTASKSDDGMAECWVFMNVQPPPEVNLSDIGTIEVLDYMVEFGVLTQARKAQILTGIPR